MISEDLYPDSDGLFASGRLKMINLGDPKMTQKTNELTKIEVEKKIFDVEERLIKDAPTPEYKKILKALFLVADLHGCFDELTPKGQAELRKAFDKLDRLAPGN